MAKIEHVVVLMMENRSFDHIFGFRPGVNGLTGHEFNVLDPDSPPSDANPRFFANTGAPYRVVAGEGPAHSLNATNFQLANRKAGPSADHPARNDGFVRNYRDSLINDHVHEPTGEMIRVVMESFAPSQLPSINALADHFALCDNWYSEVPGPTQPNRLFVHAGTSAGFAHNKWDAVFDQPTIYNRVQDKGLSWATYEFDKNEVREFSRVNAQPDHFKLFEEAFRADVRANTLANYSFIIPRFFNTATAPANSQHGPQDARHGDRLIAEVYESLRSNPAVWEKSVLVVTYDECGGFYDHVVPPAGVPNPDGKTSPPPGDASFAPPFDFTRLGLRVPAVIVSPWVKKGVVDSTRYQHTSILATARKLFDLGEPLTKRDASATPFDALFTLPAPRTDTPETLPKIDPPAQPFGPDDPRNPANRSLDTTHLEVLSGIHQRTLKSHAGTSLDDLPDTQGEAAELIRKWVVGHFGPHGRPGHLPKTSGKKTSG